MGILPDASRFRAAPCRHCNRPVVYDGQGRPIHTNLIYNCFDPWGQVVGTTAELPAAVVRR